MTKVKVRHPSIWVVLGVAETKNGEVEVADDVAKTLIEDGWADAVGGLKAPAGSVKKTETGTLKLKDKDA